MIIVGASKRRTLLSVYQLGSDIARNSDRDILSGIEYISFKLSDILPTIFQNLLGLFSDVS